MDAAIVAEVDNALVIQELQSKRSAINDQMEVMVVFNYSRKIHILLQMQNINHCK